MKTVIYKGTSDFQEFGKADFAKAGVDQGKLVFAQGEPKEVSDEVFDALLSTDPDESIFHDFSFEAGPDADEEENDSDDEPTKARKKAAKKSATSKKAAQTSSGSDQQDFDGAAGTSRTGGTAPVGNGSSTAGSTP